MRGIVAVGSSGRLGAPAEVAGRMARSGPDPSAPAVWSDGRRALAASGASRLVVVASGGEPGAEPALVLAWDGRLDERERLRGELEADERLLRAARIVGPALDTRRSSAPVPEAGDGRDGADALLVAAAFARWGESALERLIGDFALVAWDPRRGVLVAARDVMGMRPLYVWQDGEAVLVASEVRQLLASGGPSGEIDERMAAAHLAGPYGRPEWTFYQGVATVRPGELVELSGTTRRAASFASPAPQSALRVADPREYEEAFRATFLEAVASRSSGSGPVALMLSGGLDSGAVAAGIGWQREQGGALADGGFAAYRWAFRDPELAHDDERAASRDVIDRYGIDARDVYGDDAWPLAPGLTPEPHVDSPFQRVYAGLDARSRARAAADGATVLLTADRGDELVGDWVFGILGMARGAAWRVPGELRAVARLHGTTLSQAVRKHIVGPALRSGPFARSWTATGRRSLRVPEPPGYVRSEFARAAGLHETMAPRPALWPGSTEAARQRLARIVYARGIRDPVVTEREAAAHGLRWADPWSDVRLARLVLSMPPWRVQRPSEPKALARNALRGIVPERARSRLDKHQPGALFDRAFREREVDQILRLFTGSQLEARGWANERWLREAALAYARGGVVRADLWWSITLERWLRRHHG